MINEIICFFKGHIPIHIANFSKSTSVHMQTIDRGLWQCTRCKKIHMDAPYEFYAKRKKKYPTF